MMPSPLLGGVCGVTARHGARGHQGRGSRQLGRGVSFGVSRKDSPESNRKKSATWCRPGGRSLPKRHGYFACLGLRRVEEINYPISHPIFGPPLTDSQSQNPRSNGATPAVLLNRIGQIRPKSGRDFGMFIFFHAPYLRALLVLTPP